MLNRNKLFVIISLIVVTTSFSCKKFLQEYSQDEMRPSSIDDLNSIMYSDAYPYTSVYDDFLDLLTDDIQSNVQATTTYTTQYTNGLSIYQFNASMFDGSLLIPSGSNSWTNYYKKIKGCNVVLNYLDNVSGSDSAKANTRGQALFLRSFYYFKLVNLYAQPFNRLDIDTSTQLGVPLVLDMVVTDQYPVRNTLAECYHQIENDLLLADSLLTQYPTATSLYRVGSLAADLLLSRMYLYRGQKNDWDKVIYYATKAINKKNDLSILSNASYIANYATYPVMDPTNSIELIWTYGANQLLGTTGYFPTLITGSFPPYSASNELSNLYTISTSTTYKGDLRYLFYLTMTAVSGSLRQYYTGKVYSTSTNGVYGLRVTEAYMNRAEAYLNKYKLNGSDDDRTNAEADINLIRKNRYDTRNVTYTNVDITNYDSLYHFYQQERRREFCFEDGHRWFDIRRWGLSVTHSFTDNNNVTTTYKLDANSLLYALPIPYDAINANYKLTQNPR